MKSGGSCCNYASGIVCSLIELGLADKSLTLFREKYGEQMEAMCVTLDENLPRDCVFKRPKGGYFVWIEFKSSNIDCNDLNQFCLKNYKVVAIPGDRFSAELKFKNCIRLSFAFHKVEVIRESVKRLCDGIKEYLSLKPESSNLYASQIPKKF